MHAPRVLTSSSDTPDPFLPLPQRSAPWGADSGEVLPAALLPEQFHNAPQALYHKRGEAVLMRAVLEDALACFQNQCGAPPVRDRLPHGASQAVTGRDRPAAERDRAPSRVHGSESLQRALSGARRSDPYSLPRQNSELIYCE